MSVLRPKVDCGGASSRLQQSRARCEQVRITAAIFFDKTKMGWIERVVNKHAKKDGKPFLVDDGEVAPKPAVGRIGKAQDLISAHMPWARVELIQARRYERNGAARIGEAPSDAVPGRLRPL